MKEAVVGHVVECGAPPSQLQPTPPAAVLRWDVLANQRPISAASISLGRFIAVRTPHWSSTAGVYWRPHCHEVLPLAPLVWGYISACPGRPWNFKLGDRVPIVHSFFPPLLPNTPPGGERCRRRPLLLSLLSGLIDETYVALTMLSHGARMFAPRLLRPLAAPQVACLYARASRRLQVSYSTLGGPGPDGM